MKKQLLLLIMMLFPMLAMAQDPIVQKDNITYTISGYYAQVKYAKNCSGNVVIPTTISYSINNTSLNATVTGIMERAFSGCSAQSISIPRTVTSISYDAFEYCRDLASIVIDSENAMYDSRDNCNAIIETSTNTLIAGCKNTIIPNSVTAINEYAFIGCRGLTNIDIPKNVTNIGTYAFADCTGMKSVVIPNSVTTIGDFAFSNCYLVSEQLTNNSTLPISDTWGITLCDEETNEGLLIKDNVAVKCRYYASDVTIPNSVTSIKYGTFSECSNLTNITIGNSMTNINISMFSGCSALTNISVSPSNTKYDSRNDCNAIIETSTNTLIAGCKNSIIPNSVTSIGDHAFSGCSSMTSVIIPNSVTSIGDYAFYGCSSMTSMIIPNSVTNIGCNAFEFCSGLTNVIIPNSVTSMGYAAFGECSGLTSIIIPSSVTTIGDCAFYECSSLTSVIVNSEKPIKINRYTFYPERNKITLYVPKGCKEAYEKASYWKEFKRIRENIPIIDFKDEAVKSICVANWDSDGDEELSEEEAAAVTSIGNVFQNNTEITSFSEFKYFTGVTTIGEYALSGCTNLSTIEFPSSLTTISRYALYNSGFTNLVFPDNVTSIGNSAVRNCTSLISVKTGNNSVSFGKNVFRYCTNLSSITFEGTECHFNGEDAFRDCGALTSAIITDISAWCKSTFYSNSNPTYSTGNLLLQTSDNSVSAIKHLVIPDDITTINDYAFYCCLGLESIVIPSSVTSIDNYAFRGCNHLTSVTTAATEPIAITSSVFPIRANAILYVPIHTKAAYEAANYWNEFKDIIEIAH